MKNLDKTKVYYLGDLNGKQESKLLSYLQKIEPESDWSWLFDSTKYIYFDKEWIESAVVINTSTDIKNVTNALTLFEEENNTMKGFIEVTIAYTGKRVLLYASNYDFTERGNVTLITACSSNEMFTVNESYEEIKQLIKDAL